MQDNHDAPPKARLEGARSGAIQAPPLWNPNAAASWCLVFTPIFGTFLHWKNWIALDEPERANTARIWFIASVVVIVGSLALALASESDWEKGLDVLEFGLLVGWYFAGAKAQATYVKERFGDTYPRRGWTQPILAAIAALIVVTGVMILLFV
jgi:hypothetical protein